MVHRGAATLALTITAMLAAAPPAGAVVKGSPSSLGFFTVRIAVGRDYCSGVAIARNAVATAAHCARRGARVLTGSGTVRVAAVTRSATLDDGRRVRASGDAAILRLASPLATGIAPVGHGGGGYFTIAGYGTTDERARGAFGALHEASLVSAGGRALVDPNRNGGIGASACFGDSGGPVMRGGRLIGVITRAAWPGKRIACGYLTRWAPLTVSGSARTASSPNDGTPVSAPRTRTAKRGKRAARPQTYNLFGAWLAPAQ